MAGKKSGPRRTSTRSRTIRGIPMTITKKDIKSLRITVKPPDGSVSVSAPLYASDDTVDSFIISRIDWIAEQRERILSLPHPGPTEYVSGETLWLFGESYTLSVVDGIKNSLVIDGDTAYFTVKPGYDTKAREKFVDEWYRARLKAYISEHLQKWESTVGLFCSSWQTKKMKTRWGTCNTVTGKLWFNLGLAKKSPVCIDYIILHELTHLRYRGHGADFSSFLDKYMPDWREIKKKLNSLP